jgi:hypothetical protein
MTSDAEDGSGGNATGLWRDFPKTATEFEARFATVAGCHAYWIAAGLGGTPVSAQEYAGLDRT